MSKHGNVLVANHGCIHHGLAPSDKDVSHDLGTSTHEILGTWRVKVCIYKYIWLVNIRLIYG